MNNMGTMWLAGAVLAGVAMFQGGGGGKRVAVQPPPTIVDEFKVVGVFVPGDPPVYKSASIVLQPEKPISVTDAYLRINVHRPNNEDYDILFGPDPNFGGTGRAHITNCPFDTTHGELYVEAGVAYLSGTHPYGGTQGGSQTSDATKAIIQARTDPDRFILVEAEVLTVHKRSDMGTTWTLPTENGEDYLELNHDGTLAAYGKIPDLPPTSSLSETYNTLKNYATAAHIH
jgi:hypothetical protein